MEIPKGYYYYRYQELVVAGVEIMTLPLEDAIRLYEGRSRFTSIEFSPIRIGRRNTGQKINLAIIGDYNPERFLELFLTQDAEPERPKRYTELITKSFGTRSLEIISDFINVTDSQQLETPSPFFHSMLRSEQEIINNYYGNARLVGRADFAKAIFTISHKAQYDKFCGTRPISEEEMTEKVRKYIRSKK